MDEIYVKIKGRRTYPYRAIDKAGKTLDFMLSEHRDEAAASTFFMKAIGNNGWPEKVVVDKSGSNTAALFNVSDGCMCNHRRIYRRKYQPSNR